MGPNIAVVCTAGSVDDVALLWNLRGALGDAQPLPIGIPAELPTVELIEALLDNPITRPSGIVRHDLYVTSASIATNELTDRLDKLISRDRSRVKVIPYQEVLHFGNAAAWPRTEVVAWRNGHAYIPPAGLDKGAELLDNGGLSPFVRMVFDVAVPSLPYPRADDVRIDIFNGAFFGGRYTATSGSTRSRSEIRDVDWPSSFLMAESLASHRGLNLAESEPGRACHTLLSGFGDIDDLRMLAHRPLLDLLNEMSQQRGASRVKKRLRELNRDPEPAEWVPPTSDDLPDRPYDAFKEALGNSDAAARSWLLRAEQSGLVIKGFPIKCTMCSASQWLPVNGFHPPILCQGCGRTMPTPFGDRVDVHFTYRLSERLRRVFSHDALGHLLTARYFNSVFTGFKSSFLVGLHPGIDVARIGAANRLGEADVLMLTVEGDFVPVEVKRSMAGLVPAEIKKLDDLAEALSAPWSAVVACGYASDIDEDPGVLVARAEKGGPYTRFALTYDHLLDPTPVMALGSDPFAPTTLSADEISEREGEFQRSVHGPGMIAGGSDHHRPLEIPGCQVHRCRRVTETILQSC